jgi:hypothetical protein
VKNGNYRQSPRCKSHSKSNFGAGSVHLIGNMPRSRDNDLRRAPDESSRRRKRTAIGVEGLEQRRLLSSSTGPPFVDVRFSGALYEIAIVSGPGGIRFHRARNGMIGINLLGTTQDSQVTITALLAHRAHSIRRLAISAINVHTGRVGSIQGLTSADLMGPISPLTGIVNSLQFNTLGQAAQITVDGNLGQLAVNQGIDLGNNGLIDVSGNLTGALTVPRNLDLAGGRIIVGQDLSGSVAIGGNLALSNYAQMTVGRNLGATATGAAGDAVVGSVTIDSGSHLSIEGNLGTLTVGGNLEASDYGTISVSGNVSSLTVSGGGGNPVTGNVTLSSGGQLFVGQNLTTFAVGSNVFTSTSGNIKVMGNLGSLNVGGGITESSGGAIAVMTDLTGALSVAGAVLLNGGTFAVGRDLSGAVAIAGDLALSNSGHFTVGRNMGSAATGAAVDTVSGNVNLDSGSMLTVGGNLSAFAIGGNLEASGSGQIAVRGNLTTLTVNGGGGGSVTGNVTLSSGGALMVDHNLTTFTIGSDLQTSGGGQVKVGGDFGTLNVTGDIQGKGNQDIVVGDDLGQLNVFGGGGNVYGLTDVNIAASDSIQGIDIRNGITGSLITAGVLVNGGTPGTGSNGWNIGRLGHVAVLDSQILAGFEIQNLIIGGDVQSDAPSNAAGQATRIVAGEFPQNTYAASGMIDTFQIIGNLIDAVLAASVEPYNGTYPEPLAGPNSTAPPFADPKVPITIVLAGGVINPSFASSSGGSPTKLTVTGGVISNIHVYPADYAGIFAATTTGVKVGMPGT